MKLLWQNVFCIYIFSFLDLQCWVPGRCQGIYLDEASTDNSNSCLDLCQANEECQWFTYDDGSCLLLGDCQQVDTSCPHCISGQRQCSEHEGIFVHNWVLYRSTHLVI